MHHESAVRSTSPFIWARCGGHVTDRPAPIDADALVTDCDGVHADGRAHLGQDGRETVQVSRQDGMGVALLRRAGVPLLILSSETNPVVRARARKPGVPVLHGVADKAAALQEWLGERGLDPARVAYVGNDVNDLGCLALVGWPVAVSGAHPRVLAAARVVLGRPGGAGAVREVCERIINARERIR